MRLLMRLSISLSSFRAVELVGTGNNSHQFRNRYLISFCNVRNNVGAYVRKYAIRTSL